MSTAEISGIRFASRVRALEHCDWAILQPMMKRARWWSSPDLYPLWSSLAFLLVLAALVALEWAEGVLGRRFIPKDIWTFWLHLPILPIEIAFGGYQWELWSHCKGHSCDGAPEVLFDAGCYALAASIYRELWRQIRGRRSSGSWILLGFLFLLFLLQFFLVSGWGIPGVRCA